MNNQEMFLPVPGFDDYYEVSNLGNIRTYRGRGRATGTRKEEPVPMHPALYRRNGTHFQPYRYVILTDPEGNRLFQKIGHLVLITFVGQRPEGYQMSHLNGDPMDDRVENLAWETHEENCARRKIHSPKNIRGGKYPKEFVMTRMRNRAVRKERLNFVEREQIRKLFSQGKGYKEIAEKFGIGYGTVYNLIKGYTFKGDHDGCDGATSIIDGDY